MDIQNIQAISLCSGGGKGAFQVGVMKALQEQGILKNIKTFAGTSVGALNAFMCAIGDIELTEYVWENIVSPSTMLKTIELNKGIYASRDSLLKMIDYVGIDRFRKASADVYAYAYNTKLKRSVPYLLNDKTDSQIRDILLATSAIPMVYEPILIDSVKHVDGGITPEGDNPVGIIRDLGLKNVLLVALDHSFNPRMVISPQQPLKPLNLYKTYPELNIDIIKPSKHNGGFMGIVDFSPESIKAKIQRGYDDAMVYLRSSGCASKTGITPDSPKKSSPVTVSSSGAKKRLTPNQCEKTIRALAEELITCAEDFEQFTALSQFEYVNAKTSTLGGHVFYKNIFEIDGWRIQKHDIFPLRAHYRILDNTDTRRAWTLSPNEMVKNLRFYKKIKNKKTE